MGNWGNENLPRAPLAGACRFGGQHGQCRQAHASPSCCARRLCHASRDGVVDFTSAFAFRLPVWVIMGLLHLPEEDEALIGELSPALWVRADLVAAEVPRAD